MAEDIKLVAIVTDVRELTRGNAAVGEGGVGNHEPEPMPIPSRRGENAVARVLFLEGRKGRHTCPAPRIS